MRNILMKSSTEKQSEELKKALINYRCGKLTKEKLINILTPYIYNLPAKLLHFDPDLTHNFYVHVISRLDRSLARYNEQSDCTFLSWFYVKLKRDFFQFMKKHKRKLRGESLIQSSEELDNLPQQRADMREKIKLLEGDTLNKREKMIVKLKYGIENSRLSEASINKLRGKRLLEKELNKKYYKLLTIHKELAETSCPRRRMELRLREKETRRIKRLIEKRYNSYNLWPSDKWVGSKLKLKRGTVSYYLYRIKQKLKKDFSPSSQYL